MIPNIADRGTDPGDLMQYLVDCESPKNRNVHEDPHVVAGSIGQEFGGILSRADAHDLAADLRLNAQLNKVASDYRHVWHCSLSLKADEGRPSDEKWRAVADDFMREMGFTGAGKSPVQWVAIEHGRSENGNSHIHIVASTVRENGTKVRLHDDMDRAQKVSLMLEQKHGLNVLESRLVGAGARGYSMDSAVQADLGGLVEPRPIQLERMVREVAVASQTEAEFVRRARAEGLLLKPRQTAGQVTGYSVGLPAVAGEKQRFYAGGTLARDLTIGGLRRSWPDGGGSAAEALGEWTKGEKNKPVTHHGRETLPVSLKPATVQAVTAGLDTVAARMPSVDATEFAVISRDLAGALASASAAVEGATPGPLARASRDVARYAQVRAVAPSRPTGLTLRGVATMLIVAKDPTGPEAQRVMQRALIDALLKLYSVHLATRPVAMNTKGMAMTQAMGEPDQIGPAVEGMATTGLTAGALVVEMAAMRMKRDKDDVGKSSETLSEAEKAGMDAQQQAEVAPPGPATQAQLDRLDELDRLAGTHVPGVSPLLSDTTHSMNAKEVDDLIKGMEQATPEGYKPMAAPVATESPVSSPADTKQTAPAATQEAAQPKTPILSRPADWKHGQEKLTGPQRGYLISNGFDPKQVGTLTRAEATRVIGPQTQGDTEAAKAAWDDIHAGRGTATVTDLNAAKNQSTSTKQHNPVDGPKNQRGGRKA
jgi:hypothetical protein